MSTNTRLIKAPPDKIWEVLSDGWLYPSFVVGASRMREVDDDWPTAGSRLHHSVGTWPLLIDDQTIVLECEPPTLLKLQAHGWPAGAAEVTFHLESTSGATNVTIEEDAVAGPGKLVPKLLRDPQLHWRNTETLRRLAYIAERRQSVTAP